MGPQNETGWTQADEDRIGRRRDQLAETGRTWPKTRGEQIAAIERRRAAYLGLGYSDAEVQSLSLFKAVNSVKQLSAQTSRVMRDIAFVTDVDAASIASNTLRLSIEDKIPEGPERDTLEAGARAIWERSNIERDRLWWATTLCSEGEILLETVMQPSGPVVVMHRFDAYQLTYDSTGSQIVRCVIDLTLPGVETVEPDGKVTRGGARMYRRILEPDQVRVWIDGAPVADESGPSAVGVVPVARICYKRAGDGVFPLNSAYGYDDLIAALDSMLCQMRTIATRHAHPILLGIGVSAGESAELQNQGATVAIPEGTDLKWLEAALSGIDALVKTMVEVRTAMVQTLPEFLFTEAGASASGTALSYRAASFVMAIDPIRAAFYDGMERAIGYGLAMMLARSWADLGNVVDVDGGSAIPQDVAAMATLYLTLWSAGAITGADLVGYLQAAGLASDDKGAAEYAIAAWSEYTARTGDTAANIAKLQELLGLLNASESPDALAGVDDAPDAQPETPDAPEPEGDTRSPETPAA